MRLCKKLQFIHFWCDFIRNDLFGKFSYFSIFNQLFPKKNNSQSAVLNCTLPGNKPISLIAKDIAAYLNENSKYPICVFRPPSKRPNMIQFKNFLIESNLHGYQISTTWCLYPTPQHSLTRQNRRSPCGHTNPPHHASPVQFAHPPFLHGWSGEAHTPFCVPIFFVSSFRGSLSFAARYRSFMV